MLNLFNFYSAQNECLLYSSLISKINNWFEKLIILSNKNIKFKTYVIVIQ